MTYFYTPPPRKRGREGESKREREKREREKREREKRERERDRSSGDVIGA